MRHASATATPSVPQAFARTRVGNGADVLAGIDGRTAGARRYREVLAELAQEITKGARALTAAEQMLARRAALLSIWCENAEARMAKGEAIDITEFTAATNTLRRTLADAGVVFPPSVRVQL